MVLLTNYTGSTSFGEKFAQDIQGDPLLGPGNEVNEAADEAIKRFPFIDATRQVAGGASYGGHLANWLAATTTRYKRAGEPRRPLRPQDAVADQRRRLLARTEHGRAGLGGRRRLEGSEPVLQVAEPEDARSSSLSASATSACR